MQLPAYYQSSGPRHFLAKISMLMRLVSLIMILATSTISAKGLGQGISLSLKNAPLELVFSEIKNQSGYNFIYARAQLEKTSNIDLDVKNASIEEVLSLVFKDQPITYTIEKKFIVIKNRLPEKIPALPPPLLDIHGTITDPEGRPLQGVSVGVKGTNKGTQTDDKGEFIIKGVDEKAVLIVSFIGYEKQEIAVKNRTDFILHLNLAPNSLDETVVKGYYATTRRLNTGSVGTLTAETIGQQPVSNVLAALEGRVPGLLITQNTGMPGGGFSIQIRGQNSLRNSPFDNGNLPFYIIDGVPFTAAPLNSVYTSDILTGGNPLSSINPADIERIEILKDADATAIYGSRGANGVILITTKKGKEGKTKLDMSMYTGVSRIARKLDLLNRQQYLQMRNEAFKNDGEIPSVSNARDLLLWDTTRSTDWQKLLVGGVSRITDAQASISGGNTNTQFLVAGGYHKETTVFPGDFADEKGSAHFSLTHTNIDQKFKVNLSASYTTDANNLPGQDFTNQALRLSPVAPAPFDSLGNLNWENSTWNNPFSLLKQKYAVNTDNLIAHALLSYQILSGLELKSTVGYTKMQLEEVSVSPTSSFDPASNPLSQSIFASSHIKTWVLEPQAEYKRAIGDGKLNVLIGTTFQQTIQQGQTILGYGFSSDALLENVQAAPNLLVLNSNYAIYRYNAVFGRINYNWKEKYLINLTGRRDGSSRFGPGKQFADFGAIGAGWIFSKEAFIQKAFSILSYGKLRGSYGITGSDQIHDYGFIDLWTPTSNPYLGIQGLFPNSLSNPDFAWEMNQKLEMALELGFLNDRLLFSSGYFRNKSSSQLVGLPLPRITGFTSIQANLSATVENTGWEFEIMSINTKRKDLEWTSSFNLTLPRNKLLAYPGLAASAYANSFVIGQPLSILKVYNYTGVDPKTGVYSFQDVNMDGMISYPADAQKIINLAQVFYGGFNNTLKYKGFQFVIFFQFVKQTGKNWLNFFSPPGTASNQPVVVMGRWQKPGQLRSVQKFTRDFSSDAFTAYDNSYTGENSISDASYIRLKNLSLSYQFPTTKWMGRWPIQRIRIYVQGQNLFTITHYLGMDPENQSGNYLPPLKTLTAGIQVTF